MKNLKKSLSLLLAAVMLFALAACSKTETEVESNVSPEDLYISANGNVVDKYNNPAADYEVDKKGNITTAKGKVVVEAANANSYVPVEDLTVNNTTVVSYPVALSVNATGQVQPVTLDLLITIKPLTATCKEIRISSDNPSVADVANPAYAFTPGYDSMTVPVTLKAAGTAVITVSSPASEGTSIRSTLTISATADSSSPVGGTTGTAGQTGTPGAPNSSAAPSPSASPSASPTASPNATPSGTGQTGYVTGDGVNFRETPNGDIITSLGYGKQITIYSISSGWANVVVDGRAGYISASYVSYNRPAATPEPTATPTPTDDPYVNGSSEEPSAPPSVEPTATPSPTPAQGEGPGVVIG